MLCCFHRGNKVTAIDVKPSPTHLTGPTVPSSNGGPPAARYLKEGDLVQVQYKDGKWYEARLGGQTAGGWTVKYTMGGESHNVKPDFIKKEPDATPLLGPTARSLKEGDLVQVQYQDGKWYEARLGGQTAGGWTVKYTMGGESYNVKPDFIKKEPDASPAAQSLKEGDLVQVQYQDGKWYEARLGMQTAGGWTVKYSIGGHSNNVKPDFIKKEAVQDDGESLEKGDNVLVLYHRDKKYYNAILGDQTSGGWTVNWEDGRTTLNVKPEYIRKQPVLSEGDRVLVIYYRDGKRYPAKLGTLTAGGWTVHWSSGETSFNVRSEYIKRFIAPKGKPKTKNQSPSVPADAARGAVNNSQANSQEDSKLESKATHADAEDARRQIKEYVVAEELFQKTLEQERKEAAARSEQRRAQKVRNKAAAAFAASGPGPAVQPAVLAKSRSKVGTLKSQASLAGDSMHKMLQRLNSVKHKFQLHTAVADQELAHKKAEAQEATKRKVAKRRQTRRKQRLDKKDAVVKEKLVKSGAPMIEDLDLS